jgi:dipeptidyl aminopeptidase/acylaminoacyl peptidase
VAPTETPVQVVETAPVVISLPSPTATIVEPSPSPTEAPPTEAPTETPLPSGPVFGGADKVAYLDGKDIWVANLDGSELTQLTEDGTTKIDLQWTLDGEAINYISGKCVYSVSLVDKQKEIITCFNFAEFFKAFETSPDGKQVALSIDNQLYIIPNDLDLIRSISVREDLTRVAQCADFAPYLRNFVKFPRWSVGSDILAMVIMGVARDIGSADTIQVIPVDVCTPEPKPLDNFPPPRFTPEEYIAAPMIPNFGWDGRDLFALATYIRNEGFGNLYTYNMDTKKPGVKINPVDGTCCYKDPVWSPDGSHLLFAYQKYPGGDNSIQLYLIPYGTLGTGEAYSPLPLPDIQPKTLPQPILRPARQ